MRMDALMSEVTGISTDSATAAANASDTASTSADDRSTPTASNGLSAGALLRQARQAKGLHIAALAVSLKVPQRKLEALEADRYGELPDATFVRALAQTVCRALKIDPVPVLALLPQTLEPKLDRVSSGLNQPFRERPGRDDPKRWTAALRPGPLAAVALLLAALALYFAPAQWWSGDGEAGEASLRSEAAASAVSETIFPLGANGTVVAVSAENAAPVPVTPLAAASVPAVPAAPVTIAEPVSAAPAVAPKAAVAAEAGALQLRASAQTWVEVMDANGQTLISRNLASGEEIGIEGALPLKLKVGNAAGIKLLFKRQPIDLTPYTRENVARIELK